MKIVFRSRVFHLIRTYSTARNIRKFFDRRSHEISTTHISRLSLKCAPLEKQFKLPDIPDLITSAKFFKGKYGYSPITFGSFKTLNLEPQLNSKFFFLSPIVPGKPYSFNDEVDYFQAYSKSVWAITHKKGGWDCMRHLEIMASGCIPLMHDAKKIPECAMFYYPKELFAKLYLEFKKSPFLPGPDLLEFIEKWMAMYLTSGSVVQNMLNLVSPEFDIKNKKILFVDPTLAHSVDYMSAVVLHGLLQTFPSKIDILECAPRYMFDDYTDATNSLYGRGFGYSKSCRAEKRNVVNLSDINFSDYFFVVVTNSLRNLEFLEKNIKSLANTHLVLIEGGDDPMTAAELGQLQTFSEHVFSREGVR